MASLTITLILFLLISTEESFDVNRCSSTFSVVIILINFIKEYFRLKIYSL